MLLSGFQPTGDGRLHVGNYFGSVMPLMQSQREAWVMVADIHATTVTHDRSVYRSSGRCAEELARCLGDSSFIHRQGAVPEHYELGLILQHLARMGELERMTQYRMKSGEKSVGVGLFTYPTLMAADIALLRPTQIAAGADQTQHINLARDLIGRFNSCYGHALEDFDAKRLPSVTVMSLTDPSIKMSKSHPKGALYLSDDMTTVSKKIRAAVSGTQGEVRDVYQDNGQGVRSLLSLLGLYRALSPAECARRHAGYRMSDLKNALICAHEELFSALRAPYQDNDADAFLALGNAAAQKRASETMVRVRQCMTGR